MAQEKGGENLYLVMVSHSTGRESLFNPLTHYQEHIKSHKEAIYTREN